MMMTEMDIETSVYYVAREDYINFIEPVWICLY